jgi:(S)-ureidoglycine aminohydrolase
MNPLHHLGQTRSTRQPTHLLHTPDSFVRIPLPGLIDGEAIVHAAPALGAGFLQYTAELQPKGKLTPSSHQRFLYVLEGEASVIGPGLDQSVTAGAFVYMPPTQPTTFIANTVARCAVIEKKYEPLPGAQTPSAFVGNEASIAALPLNGDPGLMVRSLLPAHFGFDFAVNTMTYAPGAALAQVEVHVMEHGLLMLAGGGIYRLGDDWYPVDAGDFIWMAPFCPQWFGAIGKGPAKYLIYKDFNRSPAL